MEETEEPVLKRTFILKQELSGAFNSSRIDERLLHIRKMFKVEF